MKQAVRQAWGDRNTNQDEILRDILAAVKGNGESPGASGKLLTLAEMQEARIMDIRFFTYPATGTMATLSTGVTEFDFRNGTIKDPSGDVVQMQHSLRSEAKEALRSIYINSDKIIKVQMDTSDVIYVEEQKDLQGTYMNFQKVKVTTTEDTQFFMLCCTNPEAILTLVDKASQISGGVRMVVGSKVDVDGTLAYFETDQPLSTTPTLSMALQPTSVRKFRINSIRYLLDWDGAATGFNLYLFEAANADDIQNQADLVFESGAGKADGIHYVEIGGGVLPIEVALTDTAKLYYMIDWAGVHGNVKGFIEIRGEMMS